ALQELPARQRAVLILRDVVQFSAAEVAELLETTPAAVNSALQRARTHLAEVAPTEESAAEPDDAELRELLDRYCAAFETADMAVLTELLQADVKLEMPPLPAWFTGRDAVLRFLAARAFTKAGDMVLIPTAANGQPAVAEYRRAADSVMRAHSIHVITPGVAGIAAITVFLDPALFTVFGLPSTR
ncbi:MAG: sigma factor-like helix-turn-helix DNA-binding protein, partial [Mycobacterium sp.]